MGIAVVDMAHHRLKIKLHHNHESPSVENACVSHTRSLRLFSRVILAFRVWGAEDESALVQFYFREAPPLVPADRADHPTIAGPYPVAYTPSSLPSLDAHRPGANVTELITAPSSSPQRIMSPTLPSTLTKVTSLMDA
jgi:hypothetical protein